MGVEVSWAQVRAFRLACQHLDGPAAGVEAAAVRVGGVHGQVASASELILRARAPGLEPGEVQRRLFEERSLVKLWLMRGTLHLVPAAEHALFTAALAFRSRNRPGAWLRWYGFTEPEYERVVERIGAPLEGRCLTRRELAREVGGAVGEKLASSWGDLLKPPSYRGLLCFGPPRGNEVTFVSPRDWLGEQPAIDEGEALVELARRYVRAYGPVGLDDLAWWIDGTRVANVRAAWQALLPELEEVQVERTPLFVHRDDLRALAAAKPSRSVHLLGHFDPYVLGHAKPQRLRIVPEAHIPRVYRDQGWISPAIVAGGKVVGVWSPKRKGRRLDAALEPFAPLAPRVARSVERELQALRDFYA